MSRIDPRAAGARYYDLQTFPDDVPFYRGLIPAPDATVLDLGSGTGRLTLALADACREIHGVEISPAMLEIARRKRAALPPELAARVVLHEGDITAFDLGQQFDLVIAPYRVFQSLATDAEVTGLLDCIRRHLAPLATAVLTMFHPIHDADTMRAEWVTDAEDIHWEREIEGERIVAGDRRPRLDPDPLVLHPILFFRRYRGRELIEETAMPIVMRCWYPEEVTRLLCEHGFRIVSTWGGYRGEVFGEGHELVIQFEAA